MYWCIVSSYVRARVSCPVPKKTAKEEGREWDTSCFCKSKSEHEMIFSTSRHTFTLDITCENQSRSVLETWLKKYAGLFIVYEFLRSEVPYLVYLRTIPFLHSQWQRIQYIECTHTLLGRRTLLLLLQLEKAWTRPTRTKKWYTTHALTSIHREKSKGELKTKKWASESRKQLQLVHFRSSYGEERTNRRHE